MRYIYIFYKENNSPKVKYVIFATWRIWRSCNRDE